MKKIYVVGSINTDLVIKAPYMPVSGETLTGEGFFTAHGGKGANQAVAAARLGGREELLNKVETLLVTLGGDGFEIIKKESSRKYPCMKITPVDTTAAGDTLCGGLVAMLAEGNSLEEAAKFGSKAASIACTRKGAQPSIPTKKEVGNFNYNN